MILMMQENESGQIIGDILAVSGGLENLLVKTGSVLVRDQNGHLMNGGQKCHRLVHHLGSCIFLSIYSRTPLIQITCDGKASGYAENPDNWTFL
jgi:hypothetical protein